MSTNAFLGKKPQREQAQGQKTVKYVVENEKQSQLARSLRYCD
jgi:hypothetical protein